MRRPKVSVIMPMYNEQDCIEANVRAMWTALDGIGRPWELLLVNDGSTDRTLELISRLGEENPQTVVLSYDHNRGRGYALRRGFDAARGELVVATEADLSYGTEIIGRMVSELEDPEVDVVVASPYMEGGKLEGVPWRRRFLSRYGNKLLTAAVGGNVRTVTGMTRGYKRHVLASVALEADGKELHLELISKVMALGYRVRELPATLKWTETDRAKKRKSTFAPWKYIWSHLLFCFGTRPFMLFGTVGLIFLAAGVFAGLYAFYLSVTETASMIGRPMVSASVLFVLFGFQILVFAFLSNQSRDVKRQLVRLERSLLELKQKRADELDRGLAAGEGGQEDQAEGEQP